MREGIVHILHLHLCSYVFACFSVMVPSPAARVCESSRDVRLGSRSWVS